MAQIHLKGQPISTCGDLPPVGTQAPDCSLTKTDLSEISLASLKGQRVVLNIFPSVDTPVCATSVRRFNQEASKLKNTLVLNVSKDLPFAHARFCGAEGLENVTSVSDFRTGSCGKNFGVEICDGPLAGLLSRAVVIIDDAGKIMYTEQVPEIAQEPDYEAALAALSSGVE